MAGPLTIQNQTGMNRFYKLDSRKLTYGEYWNIVRSPNVLIPWVAKLLNIPMKFASGMPDFESVRQLEVPELEFSLRARAALQPLLDQCLAMGFHAPRYFTYESMRRDVRTSFIALLHSSGATVRLMHTLASNAQPPKEKTLAVLLSELSDGTFFFTSNQRKQFISAPGILANRLIGASPERLLDSHQRKISLLSVSNPARPVNSVEQLDDVWDRYEKKSRDFGLQRGVYVWMTPEEVANEQQGLAEVKAMTASGGAENTDVLLELHRIQNKKAGWGGIIALLVISLVVFVGVGARQWSWNYLFILLPVLFVHELGHYLAMRAFNYRNLRMFFIPFFGAAVSGQNYNVPGWKKVIVSLMGPVPGIVLGVIIGVAGMVLHQALLLKIAIVSLLLNGFNLLPVLPLDGGWVFHTLLFSRHYILDTVFRVLAALALMVGGSFMQNKILMYLGIPMLISIPAAYRTARIAAELKQRNLPPVPPEEQNIPAATAEAIIGEIKRSTTKPQSNKMMAQQALQIFETINAHPPGWVATIGLLFAHLASFGLAAVFALAFVIAQRGDLRDIFANAAFLPKHSLACGPVPMWQGSQFDEKIAAPAITLVATFPKHDAAATIFQGMTNQLPPLAALKLFGDTLLLSLPTGNDASRKKWLGELQQHTKDVFVDSTNYHAAFSISGIAPSAKAAEDMAAELNGYFNTLPNLDLVPPWQPHDPRTTAQRAHDELARQTYIRLQHSQFQAYTNAELRLLEKDLATAQKLGAQAEADALREQIITLRQKLAYQSIEAVRTGTMGPVDTKVVDLFVTLTTSETRTNEMVTNGLKREMAKLMGQVSPENWPAGDGHANARYGNVTQNGLLLNLNWISFNHLDTGPVALAAWLCDHGCIGIKYDFQAGLGMWNGEEDE
jgi:Zn-dependent protease